MRASGARMTWCRCRHTAHQIVGTCLHATSEGVVHRARRARSRPKPELAGSR